VMDDVRESDGCIVPTKLPNRGRAAGTGGKEEVMGRNEAPAGRRKPLETATPHPCGKDRPKRKASLPAEEAEGRHPAKGNSGQQNMHRTQGRERMQQALERVRQAAKKDKGLRFTALMHHVYSIDTLREAYFSLKRRAAPGVDGRTWTQYGEGLEEKLKELSSRLRRGAYRAKPVRRAYIPKADGRQRPIGVTAMEDKIVQAATAEVLNAVYERDFLGFSYGSRPGRGQHDALDAVSVGIQQRRVSWVLDADLRGFYDAIDQGWMVKFVEHRIGDKRIVRLIQKWMKAGVLEDGKRERQEKGTPQGGVISPLLANVYLHYALDLWVNAWRRREGCGDLIIIRYVDDFVVGLQHRDEAERFLADLRQRLGKFGLELHPDKTRLIQFGRFASERRAEQGKGKPETFEFLGFTHCCGVAKNGGFEVKRKTMKKRQRAKLKELKGELKRRRHDSVPEVGEWLRSVLDGHYRYYGVPHNVRALHAMQEEVTKLWKTTLGSRSQKGYVTWTRMRRLKRCYLPDPKIYHPFPNQRLCVKT
jgi:RNA-directed DNA polymerase